MEKEHADALIDTIHVSEDGYVYMGREIVISICQMALEVIHSKKALLIQIPHDFVHSSFDLRRKTTLILKESSGVSLYG